jgi:hypothetical protein
MFKTSRKLPWAADEMEAEEETKFSFEAYEELGKGFSNYALSAWLYLFI